MLSLGGTAAVPVAAARTVEAARLAPWRAHIDEAARRFGVPVTWIERVMMAESGGRTSLHGRPVVSSAGAMGLMQLMPGTWHDMRRRLGLGRDPHAPRDNILAGTLYLRLMYDRFGYPGLFGAYNAGPARYSASLNGKQSLPLETRRYIDKVAGSGSSPVGPAPGRLVMHRTPQRAYRGGLEGAPGPVEESGQRLFFIRR